MNRYNLFVEYAVSVQTINYVDNVLYTGWYILLQSPQANVFETQRDTKKNFIQNFKGFEGKR